MFDKILLHVFFYPSPRTVSALDLRDRAERSSWAEIRAGLKKVIIYISHKLVPALVKDKKNEQPHAGRTSIRVVTVILKKRQHVASQHISLFKFFQ